MNHIDRIEQLRADLARVTAELEHHKSVKETIDSAHKELSREHAALRARFAELEKDNKQYSTEFRAQQKKLTEHDRELAKTTAALKLTQQLRDRAEQRNAELVAALEFWRDLRNESKGLAYYHLNGEVAYWGEFDDPTDKALASAETATPAKHPDTDGDCGCDEPLGATFARAELRAIDVAMKGGAHD